MIKREYIKTETVSIDEIDKAIEAIYRAFVWNKTTQGHTYWSNVCRKLKKLKEQVHG